MTRATTNINSALVLAAMLLLPLECAGSDQHGHLSLMLVDASEAGDIATVRALLAQGAHVNARDSAQENTALMVASFRGHLDVVQALLSKGADLNAKTKRGNTALTAPRRGETLLLLRRCLRRALTQM
jgi:ankyrin repeat protein